MSSNKHSKHQKKNELCEIGPGFWNIRGRFKMFCQKVDIGTQMSIIQLSNGNFVVFDTIELDDHLKKQIDKLTNNGDLIEGVIGTHPFHTRSFLSFYKAYPQIAYYGTPRHLRQMPQIPWLGDLQDCNVRQKWEPDVEMRITAGGEFVNPQFGSSHLMSVFIYHPASRTLHVNDTIMYTDRFNQFLKLFGKSDGIMIFHTSIKNCGLHPTADAPYLFRDWMRNMLNDWPFDNICCAHLNIKIGGAHAQVTKLLDRTESLFVKLSKKNKKKNPNGELPNGASPNTDIIGDECG
ncbi:unnamed protein product [Adineta steineri]|uniref:Metallo-beta-lactamase domain-containing protein n=3 Tax=Adineta steineri TaxID=433720 RepID=A0A815R5F8_9BILA|nr:unnamed protein product [Adineta steineri]CAF1472428.1 unnamed protein product [Adineta steineri]CAF3980719.1 unnamed protein product [Adineta steineri]